MTKKCHENSGGYALCSVFYIVMCAILHVVAYFLSVNFFTYVHCLCGFMCGITFSFEGIKKFLT